MDARTGLPVVGMVGAGQLARMTHQAAIALGQSLRVLAAAEDESAALVVSDLVLGDHRSYADLERFAAGCQVVTWDHEHVSGAHIRALAAAGHVVAPGADALVHAQDKRVMRERLDALGVGVPTWSVVSSAADLEAFAAEVGWPVVLKAVTGGYDGHGVWVIEDVAAAGPVLASGVPLLVEQQVAMTRELAAVVARSPYGQVAAWPVVQTVQRAGICVEVLAPAPGLDPADAAAAQQLAIRIAAELGVVGVLAVELFETPAGLLVNELAMRPHNSAHWTIEGSVTSQFEQHLRAVLDYPLGRTELTAPAVAMANVLGGPAATMGMGTGTGTGTGTGMVMDERVHHAMARWPEAKIHLYGKQPRPGRKLGHVTVCGTETDVVRAVAVAAARFLGEGE